MMDPRRSSKRQEISDRADRVMSVGSAAERVGVPGSGRLFLLVCCLASAVLKGRRFRSRGSSGRMAAAATVWEARRR